jgi:hypothetical protein
MKPETMIAQLHNTLLDNQPITLMEALITGAEKVSKDADVSMLSALKAEIKKWYGKYGIRVTIARSPRQKIIVTQIGNPSTRELIVQSQVSYYDIDEKLMNDENNRIAFFKDLQYAEMLAKELNNSPIRGYDVEEWIG